MIPQVSITDKVIDFIEKSNQISENVGDPSDLLTDEKDILILSVNEIIVSMNEIDFRIGDLTSLVTTNQESVVSALNELRGTNYSTFGSVEMQYDLEVQRLDGKIDDNDDYIIYTNNLIGTLSSLDTVNKTSIVNSINELDATSSVIFKIENYPDLGIEQFMGFLGASNFIGSNKENHLKYPETSGQALFSELNGSRYWGKLTGISDYVDATYNYNQAIIDKNKIFSDITTLQTNASALNTAINSVNDRVLYPIDTQIYVTVAATTVIDASLGDTFMVHLNRNTTFSFINFAAPRNISLYIAYGNLYTITWPANTFAPKGYKPQLKEVERVSVLRLGDSYWVSFDTTYSP